MATKTYTGFGNKVTPQSEPIPDTNQIQNSAGGYSFPVDDWKRLDRFLVLGSEGGSYYSGERELTLANLKGVQNCIKADGLRVVRRVVEISEAGRAPKNTPALFILAVCASKGDLETRQAAFAALPNVARIGTHLFQFLTFVTQFRGFGRGLRSAVANWYESKTPDHLAFQVAKYQQREGWSHHDVLHHVHAKAAEPARNAIYHWAKDGLLLEEAPKILLGTNLIQKAESAKDAAKLIAEYRLPREVVPTQFLNSVEVWETLLEDMPMTALIRNLATMTKIGLLKPLSEATKKVTTQLGDVERIRKARVHPLAVLFALRTYESGHGFRSDASWSPVSQIVDALDEAFYTAFGNVEPTGKRLVLALDVSGSMGGNIIAGTNISAREASAAMALVTARTEPNYAIVGFSTTDSRNYWMRGNNNALVPITISPRQRLDSVIKQVSEIPMGGTDCALPMVWALGNKMEADAFVEYTDSESWAGPIHASQALGKYRREMNIPAKLVIVAMVANEFSVCDQNDAGSLDVVGFDTATPQLISDFCADKI